MGGYVALAPAAESDAVESVVTLATNLAWTPRAPRLGRSASIP
jgi:hypothetical protein